MATPEHTSYIPVEWDNEFKSLTYYREEFNDESQILRWVHQGYNTKTLTGYMCDMRQAQPSWNSYIVGWFAQQGWKDIGTSYYRMDTNTLLPVHQDTYKRYIDLYHLKGQESSIRRAIVFLEDWQSGHYLEVDGQAVVHWRAGDTVSWAYDTPHMAANMGLEPRYTLQVTGHL